MATIIKITGKEVEKDLSDKLKIFKTSAKGNKKFPASKFTGKIKSFGDGLAYQRKLRDEWD